MPKIDPNKPVVHMNGLPAVEYLKHQKGYSGALQDQVVGKPRVDHPRAYDANAADNAPKNFMQKIKEAYERGFIKAAIKYGSET